MTVAELSHTEAAQGNPLNKSQSRKLTYCIMYEASLSNQVNYPEKLDVGH